MAHAEWAWRSEKPDLLANFYRGIKAYRSHPYRREVCSTPIVWTSGDSQLHDYGPEDGWPVLVVPSLINRPYILDLIPGAGLLGTLCRSGLRPFLLDWGRSGGTSRRLSLDDIITDRLGHALDWIRQDIDARPLVLGYCMGGTLATALACLRPGDLAGLALLAAPWDFSAHHERTHIHVHGTVVSAMAGLVGSATVDMLQTMFATNDSLAVPRKFAQFASSNPDPANARRFVAIEDWLNDGEPLGVEIAATCLHEWYDSNAPMRGAWTVNGMAVRPERLDLPICFAIPESDRIVPAASALALAALVSSPTIIRPRSGHVGMVAGARAENELWKPLANWLRSIAALQKNPWRNGGNAFIV